MDSLLNLYRKKNADNLVEKAIQLNGSELDEYYLKKIFKKVKETFNEEEIKKYIEENFSTGTLDDDTFSEEILRNLICLFISKYKKSISFPLYVKFEYDNGYWTSKFFEIHIPHFLDCLDSITRIKYERAINKARNSLSGLDELIELQQSLKGFNEEYYTIIEKIERLCMTESGSENIIKMIKDEKK